MRPASLEMSSENNSKALMSTSERCTKKLQKKISLSLKKAIEKGQCKSKIYLIFTNDTMEI